MIEERRTSAGVVRARARSFPWRCVALPSGARAASPVTAIVQRRPHHASLCSQGCSRCVDNQAGGLQRSGGSRIRPPRMATGGWPEGYPTAGSVALATSRGPAPDPSSLVSVLHGVCSSAPTAARVGRRFPVRRGRPRWPGARGGGGSERAAARRRRVMTLTRGNRATRARHARAAQRRSATTTPARPGPQRRPRRRLCQARASTGCWRRPRGA